MFQLSSFGVLKLRLMGLGVLVSELVCVVLTLWCTLTIVAVEQL